MKKPLLGLLFAALLAGCSSTPDLATKTYLLPKAKSSDAALRKSQPILLIQTVKVAGYLAGEGIAYQTSDTEIVIAQNNLWGESLSQQVTERLVNQLRTYQTDYWPMYPNASLNSVEMPRLQVNINRFDGDYLGNATVAGDWVLLGADGDVIESRTFYAQEPLEDEGYQALVNALSKALDSAVRNIGFDLNKVSFR
ncbi:ABC-type transport auxiliary lipoprotein family protein [Grimontia kaedaensis]|uniref:Type IV secretion system putative lipoprotein virB7 n=1 Tax=Grimontia kaedaensis TaxID=2872157 RepID=A0ABY4X2B9_9GAMM|nr:ABC-type transport auxiliary lipoprotein family protein [Grimontia kaedaensis]USH05391.1 ABC-type transport auxiliary lipoprotein family protein [Grimontia kaedaensis]